MTRDSLEKRNFLFFLSEIRPLNLEDCLIGALSVPSSWESVAKMVDTARQKDPFVRAIKKLQLYVHVPFCGRICTFCHCSRTLLRRRSEVDDYIKVLTRQMMFFSPVYKGMNAGSICFGGGTPSVLDAQQIAAVLDGVDKAFPASDRKILFEVNPSSWSASKLAVLSNRGLNRLSIGVQSFDEKILKQVSRPQTKKKVLWCLRSARKAKIPHVNVDIIAGLPGQTVRGLIKDLKILIDEGVNLIHVQPYTSLSWKELCNPGESIGEFLKRRDVMMKTAVETLLQAGFQRKGLGAYIREERSKEPASPQEPFVPIETATAAFGPFAMGEFPGAIYYRAGALSPTLDFPKVEASAQDAGYAMSQYALLGIINGLDEKEFLKRFGVSLEQHCGEGLRFLKEYGLVSSSKGIWKFFGKWEFRRVRDYVALSRVLFSDELLSRLRTRFSSQYDPSQDYSEGKSFLKAYTHNWLMTLYYQREV